MLTVIKSVLVSQLTVEVPVPVEALGGLSLSPLKLFAAGPVAVNVSVAALAGLTPSTKRARIDAA
jgi:hypothetical protein